MAAASSRNASTRVRAAAARSKVEALAKVKTLAKPAAKAKASAAVSKSKPAVKAAAKPAPKPAAPAKPPKPVELHYWPTPNGWKVSVMLEECGLPYEAKPVNIGRGEQFTPEFLKLSPNNRIPAITDPEGPNGKPISIFESGAILQYLGRKTGKFYPADERGRVEVDEWLFWQMAGLGPMAGQAHHFRQYAPETIPYAIERYTNEVNRLYGVMNRRLTGRDYLAGKYSIADIACYTWIVPHQMQGQNLGAFPALKAWYERIGARPGVQRGMAVGKELRTPPADLRSSQDARRVLFGQRAR